MVDTCSYFAYLTSLPCYYNIRIVYCWYYIALLLTLSQYEVVSKSPRTMLITRKSLVVHEFPAKVCSGDVL